METTKEKNHALTNCVGQLESIKELERALIRIEELVQMTSNNHHEESLKAAKRAEVERIWFHQEATNKELLEAYKSLDVKKEDV